MLNTEKIAVVNKCAIPKVVDPFSGVRSDENDYNTRRSVFSPGISRRTARYTVRRTEQIRERSSIDYVGRPEFAIVDPPLRKAVFKKCIKFSRIGLFIGAGKSRHEQ